MLSASMKWGKKCDSIPHPTASGNEAVFYAGIKCARSPHTHTHTITFFFSRSFFSHSPFRRTFRFSILPHTLSGSVLYARFLIDSSIDLRFFLFLLFFFWFVVGCVGGCGGGLRQIVFFCQRKKGKEEKSTQNFFIHNFPLRVSARAEN